MSADARIERFIAWFTAHGGTLSSDVGLIVFSDVEGGRGAVALRAIADGSTLFSIPRSLLLSTRTCSLPSAMGEDWRKYELDKGWAGLMLCMMWEESKGPASPWDGYLESMPHDFESLMFWSDDELQELEGSYILGKIGKAEAEDKYYKNVLPAIQNRPDLFPSHLAPHFSLHKYHIMGSRILSRSFHVEPWQDDAAEEADETIEQVTNEAPQFDDGNLSPAIDTDGDVEMNGEDQSSEGSDNEGEAVSDIGMTPMADMLNARSGCNNARLFYEKDCLNMVATKPIAAGEQIWNTYGDPPNADLLRRYGHVDVVPLPNGKTGNPADDVEIRANIIVDVAASRLNVDRRTRTERVEWWLDQGGDEQVTHSRFTPLTVSSVFELDGSLELSKAILSFVRLMVMPESDWQKAKTTDKPPKGKSDPQTLSIVATALEARLAEYLTKLEDDEALFQEMTSEPSKFQPRRRDALVVRLGEKRILAGLLRKCKETLAALAPPNAQQQKRKASNGATANKRAKK